MNSSAVQVQIAKISSTEQMNGNGATSGHGMTRSKEQNGLGG